MSTPAPPSRSTLADVSTQIALIRQSLEGIKTDLTDIKTGNEKRLDKHEERLACTEKSVIRLEQDIKNSSGLLVGLQVIIGGVAAWLGSKL